MRILIADSQYQVRHALQVLLAQQPGVQVVGQAANGQELLAQAGLGAADLVLVEWELPGLAEAGGLAALRHACPTWQIVVLSSRPGVRRTVLALGSQAFVSKSDPPERLLAVIRRCRMQVKEGGAHVAAE